MKDIQLADSSLDGYFAKYNSNHKLFLKPTRNYQSFLML